MKGLAVLREKTITWDCSKMRRVEAGRLLRRKDVTLNVSTDGDMDEYTLANFMFGSQVHFGLS